MAYLKISSKHKKMDIQKIIITIVIVIAVISLFSLPFITKERHVCGDGVCSEKEIDFCYLDCEEQCITMADGNIEEECSVGWASTYLQLADEGVINYNHLIETEEIDFSNENIQILANQLKRETIKDTARATAEWTYYNIVYDYDHKYSDCINWKSSEILERKRGLCSTMSKVNIALLRANGIPAYSVTGCLQISDFCRIKQTFLKKRLPKVMDIFIDETGHAPTTGGLHNWVIIPLYEDGEVEEIILESTSGRLYEDPCVNYRSYYTDPDDSIVCGLDKNDPNVENCKNWI